MPRPPTKAARQRRIAELVNGRPVRSQAELAKLLAGDGMVVTQATLSRDLEELGAARIHVNGGVAYAVALEGGPAAEPALSRLLGDFVVDVDSSANLAVVRTPPGGAHLVASALDRAGWPEIVGTVAGDDTVLLVSRAARGGAALARRVLDLASTHQTKGSP